MKGEVKLVDPEFILTLSKDEMDTVARGVGHIPSTLVALGTVEHERFWQELKTLARKGGIDI